MTTLDSYDASADLGLSLLGVWDGASTTCHVTKATCGITATLKWLTLKGMKFGSPNATLRFEVHKVNPLDLGEVNLVDWSATFNASTLSAVRWTNKKLALTQDYVCGVGEVLWVGCVCTAKVVLNATNYPAWQCDAAIPNRVYSRISGVWNLLNFAMEFVLEGDPYTPLSLGSASGNSAIAVFAGIQGYIHRRKKRRFIATLK